MASTIFTDNTTIIYASWLNDVNTAVYAPVTPTTTLTGDVTGTGAGSVATTLKTVNSNVGVYGTTTKVPTITVNGKGLVTSVVETTITASAQTGTGGTTLTGSVTLTVASAGSMVVTPTAPSLYATLPDATTLTKSMSQFSIYNAGEFDYGIKDSAGTTLGWIRSQTGAVVGLADNATATGIWSTTGVEKLGITAAYNNTTTIGGAQALRRVTVDATRIAYLFGGSVGGGISCVILDTSTGVFGALAVVDVSLNITFPMAMVLSAANQLLVVYNTSAASMTAVTLTLSGTGITVNTGTKATGTTTSVATQPSYSQLIPISTSWVLGYGASGSAGLRAFTVSGTTPTIGAETLVTGSANNLPALFVTGSIVRVVVCNTTAIKSTPYTLSAGTTLTIGTAASITTSSAATYRAVLNGNGNILVQFSATVNTSGVGIFKLTGTVEAQTSVSLGAGSGLFSDLNKADYIHISASKTLVAYVDTAGTGIQVALVTDSSGTVSIGTVVSKNYGVTPNGVKVGSLVVTANYATIITTDANWVFLAGFDCSGANPAQTTASVLHNGTGNMPAVVGADMFGVRSALSLYSTSASYSVDGTALNALKTSSKSTRQISSINLGVMNTTANAVGASSNDSTFAGSTESGSAGFVLQRVECAA